MKSLGEVQVQKSPAEFFAENQTIAGFDNLGKSLYTTIRELIENGLDACEAIDVLPEIMVDITELSENEFNQQQNATMGTMSSSSFSASPIVHDVELFEKKKNRTISNSNNNSNNNAKLSDDIGGHRDGEDDEKKLEEGLDGVDRGGRASATKKKVPHKLSQESYFLIKVKDNGCGMRHSAIPNSFGRVLSGSKYGVRQTRGKFGLGAKMALIWAKKSSGQPVRVTTAHRPTSTCKPPETVSICVLDIDIIKNEPRILEYKSVANSPEQLFTGTEVQVVIAGNWSTYKSRILQYLQQLAIITPYAALQLRYSNSTDPRRDMVLQYDRRSEKMPPTPTSVKHHPASVNNIIIQQLAQSTKSKTLVQFLGKELSAVSTSLAKRLIAELQAAKVDVTEEMSPKSLTDQHITRLVQLFRKVMLFKPPDGSCLSPLGEYNLNLGIHKVLEPELIATARDKASAYEGHPFVVEAAVCLGSKILSDGISVFRFANRIPLLFEGGADVSTRVALTKIKWMNYKIDPKRDRVGVFVSIVSTKIPFKGTSKEYIGDDATAIHDSVKRTLQSCCQQLRIHLSKRNALKDAQTRKSRLSKYVPDISRAIMGLLDGLRKRKRDEDSGLGVSSPLSSPSSNQFQVDSPTMPSITNSHATTTAAAITTKTTSLVSNKRLRLNEEQATLMIQKLDRGEVSATVLAKCLQEVVENDTHMIADGNFAATEAAQAVTRAKHAVPLYITPIYNLDDDQHDWHNSLFTFRPIHPIPITVKNKDSIS